MIVLILIVHTVSMSVLLIVENVETVFFSYLFLTLQMSVLAIYYRRSNSWPRY